MTEAHGYKIIGLQAENVKRISAVNIKPNGALVELTGKNRQGKTSVLDAIAWALEGTSNIQAAPIRKGWTEARIRLDLGELIVTRKFKAKEEGGFTTSITVESADGAKYPSPQSMLDKLIGALAFDPLAFTRMKPADQVDALKRLVPGVDFDGIDAANRKDFEERTAVNRRAKDLRAQAEGIAIPAGPPPEPVDETALVADLEKAGEHNAEIERRKGNRDQATRDIEGASKRAFELEAEAQKLEEQAAEMREKAVDLHKQATSISERLAAAGDLPTPIDTSAVRAKIEEARRANAGVTAHKQKAELLERTAKEEARSKELTAAIEKRTAEKADAIAKAKLPVDGIGFGDGGVTLDGQPFEQGSDAEQLAASIAIAAAMNPKLRVIRVRDGSLLDEDAMRLLAEFAEKHDMQVWIETVSSGRPNAFVLEDGHLKGVDVPAAVAAE